MTIRRILIIIASIFNLFSSIFSIIAFFSVYPKIAMAYFFISLPIFAYCMLSSPKKILDTDLNNWTENYANNKLEASPF